MKMGLPTTHMIQTSVGLEVKTRGEEPGRLEHCPWTFPFFAFGSCHMALDLDSQVSDEFEPTSPMVIMAIFIGEATRISANAKMTEPRWFKLQEMWM